jgi:ABC-type transport system substrate-binding protein
VKAFSYLPPALVILAGVLAGCHQQANTTAEAPVRIRWARDPESLDPFAQPNQAAIEGLNLLGQSMLGTDPDKQLISPLLARAMPTTSLRGDSLTLVTFELRPEARWDNGRAVLASDVAFTMRLMQCPQVPAEGTRSSVEFVKATELDPANPHRITFVCRGHHPSMGIAIGDFLILPESYLDPKAQLRSFTLAQLRSPGPAALAALTEVGKRYEAAQLSRHPENLPGSGPYRLTQWESGRVVVFTRKTHWWGDSVAQRPLLLTAIPKQLRYQVLPDDAAATLALRRGEVDVYPNIPARTYYRLEHSAEASKQLRFYTHLSPDVVLAGFNTSRPALADTATRHALSYLFDAQALAQASQLGLGKRTVGLFSPTNPQDYNDSLALLPFRPALAEARLRQAGWVKKALGWQRAGVPLRLSLRYRAADPTYELVALQFAEAAQAIGVQVQIVPTEASLLTTALQEGDFDMYVQLSKGNPFRFDLSPILTKAGIGGGNFTRFTTPSSDQLIKALAVAETPAQRTHLLRKVQVMLREQMPFVPLFFVPNRIAASREVTNLHPYALKPGYQAAAIERRVGHDTAVVASVYYPHPGKSVR